MAKTVGGQYLMGHTHTVIRSFYGGASGLILQYLHNDIVWINILTGQTLYGYCSVSSSLLKIPRPSCSRIIHGPSHILQVSPDTWAVTCEYSVLLQTEEQQAPEYYSSSLIWKEEKHVLKLIYVHMSPAKNLQPESCLISFQGRHAQVHRISPEEILYVEASNIHSCIHCRSGRMEASQSISLLENMLPGYFMRTHRSFIVNKQYVRRIYRYGLELTTGIQLPVPEKRYMKVVCWLET